MNDNRHDEAEPSAGAGDRAPIAPEPEKRAPRVASRRYMLLKGVTRGAAILAAATPIKTLASIPSVTSNVDGMICTLSGTQSGVVSASTGLPICGGKKPSSYKDLAEWPDYSASNPSPTYQVGGRTIDSNSSFRSVFDAGGGNSLLYILKNSPRSDRSHWIAALLNAIAATFPGGYVFPYTPEEVLSLYAGSQQADALAFFKGFTATL